MARMRYPAPGIPRSVVVLLGFAKRTGRQEIPRSIVAMTLNIALVGAGGMGMRHATATSSCGSISMMCGWSRFATRMSIRRRRLPA